MSQSTHDHDHATSNRQYFTTWCWLLLMTMFALIIGYLPHDRIPEGIKAILLVGTTLAKILLIGRIFMHLKFEKMNLVMLTLTPLLISAVLYFMTRGETRGNDATHQVITHLGEDLHVEAAHEK